MLARLRLLWGRLSELGGQEMAFHAVFDTMKGQVRYLTQASVHAVRDRVAHVAGRGGVPFDRWFLGHRGDGSFRAG